MRNNTNLSLFIALPLILYSSMGCSPKQDKGQTESIEDSKYILKLQQNPESKDPSNVVFQLCSKGERPVCVNPFVQKKERNRSYSFAMVSKSDLEKIVKEHEQKLKDYKDYEGHIIVTLAVGGAVIGGLVAGPTGAWIGGGAVAAYTHTEMKKLEEATGNVIKHAQEIFSQDPNMKGQTHNMKSVISGLRLVFKDYAKCSPDLEKGYCEE